MGQYSDVSYNHNIHSFAFNPTMRMFSLIKSFTQLLLSAELKLQDSRGFFKNKNPESILLIIVIE